MAKIILSLPDEALAEALVYLAKPTKDRPTYTIVAAYSTAPKEDADAFPEFTDAEIDELFHAPIAAPPKDVTSQNGKPDEKPDAPQTPPRRHSGYATDEELANVPPDYLSRMLVKAVK